MAWVSVDSYLKNLLTLDNSIDHNDAGTTIKIALVTVAYVPDRAADAFFSDVSANEVSGTGYTAGGNEITSKTVTVSSNVITFDAADPAAWAEDIAGFDDARFAILYKDTGVEATSPLIAYHDMTTDQGNTAGDFKISLSASGIATLS